MVILLNANLILFSLVRAVGVGDVCCAFDWVVGSSGSKSNRADALPRYNGWPRKVTWFHGTRRERSCQPELGTTFDPLVRLKCGFCWLLWRAACLSG